MSLFRQVSILLSIIFIILFFVIATISFNIIKNSAKQSLYENVQNSGSSISLAITNANLETSTIKTVLNASFDNGNFEKIVFKDMEEKTIYSRIKKQENNKEDIPSWFLNLTTLEDISSATTVSNGWKVIGTLEVYANRDVFYKQLYEIFINLLITLVSTFVFFIVVIFILFKTILKPLDIIKKQSEAIMKNEFIFQETLPFTSEFKSLTISINTMLKKIQDIFNQANKTLKRNKELLYVDELTQLYNRRYLILKLNEYLEENSINHEGFIISIVLTRIDLLNKSIGYKKVDQLFIKITELIKKQISLNESNLIVRANASEFIIILPRVSENKAKESCEKLSSTLKFLLQGVEDEEIKLHLGLCSFKNETSYRDILSKIDYTLCQSKASEHKSYFYQQKGIYNTRDDWRNIINDAILNQHFILLYRDVLELNSKNVAHKTISFKIETTKESFFYGEFIAPVIELNLLQSVYLKIIENCFLLKEFKQEITIQIPSQFIEKLPFEELVQLFNKKDKFKNIIFEIEEESFSKFKYNCITFIKLVKEYGYEIAIFNFLGISDDFNYLKEQKPKFIKINQSFIKIDENINALNMIRKSLGLKIIVTSINNKEDLEFIKQKDIELIAGKITDEIKNN